MKALRRIPNGGVNEAHSRIERTNERANASPAAGCDLRKAAQIADVAATRATCVSRAHAKSGPQVNYPPSSGWLDAARQS